MVLRRYRLGTLLAFTLFVVMSPLSSRALVVGDQVIWGFDNKVVPGYINPLSVRVFNDTPEPFDGELKLQRRWGGQKPTILVQPIYVSPYTERWVQFPVYLAGAESAWTLTWGRRPGESLSLDTPRRGPPTRVILNDDSILGAGQIKLPQFPAHLFPASVTALEGLHSVVMDSAPSWEPNRRGAFLDWLKLGGTLHLIHGPDGRYPTFAGELALLNGEQHRQRVGAGHIIRHERRRKAVTPDYLTKKGFRLPQLEQPNHTSLYRFDDSVFTKLRAQLKVEHNWALIHIIVFLYICLIGPPVNGVLAKRWKNHVRALLLFLAAVVGCGFLLGTVGRRGYGESNAVKSVAIARHIDDGNYDVWQWSILFSTRSRRYDVTHDSTHNAYSTGDSYMASHGEVRSGPAGCFRVNVPLFSSVSFLHRGKLPGPTWDLSVTDRKGEGKPDAPPPLKIEDGSFSEFPEDPIALWACYRGRYYVLSREDDLLIARGYGQKAGRFDTSHGFGKNDEWPCEKDVRLLIARAARLKGSLKMGIVGRTADPALIRVFVMTRAPETFRVSTPGFKDQDGYVLYEHAVVRDGQEQGDDA